MNEAEIIVKVLEFLAANFDNDSRKAWEAYDQNKDDKISKDEMSKFLKDAGVGNLFTRPVIVKYVMSEADFDGDRLISWPEFEAAMKKMQDEQK